MKMRKLNRSGIKIFFSDPKNIRILVGVSFFGLISLLTKNWQGFLVAVVIGILISVAEKKKSIEPSEEELIASGALTLKTPDQRKEILRNFVVGKVANGYRVELQDDFSAVLISGKGPNHILHLLLSIITFGFWILIWVLLAITSKEQRSLYKINDYGVIS